MVAPQMVFVLVGPVVVVSALAITSMPSPVVPIEATTIGSISAGPFAAALHRSIALRIDLMEPVSYFYAWRREKKPS